MRLMFVGDLSLGEHFFSFGHGPRSLIERGENIFDGVDQLFAGADYVIGNLEGPMSDSGLRKNDPLSRVFRASPCTIDQLISANIRILSVANNHSMQHGPAAFDDTVRALESANIHVIGKKDSDPLVLIKDDLKVGILSYSCVLDNEYPGKERYSKFDLNTCIKETKSLSEQVNCVIIYLHWGEEGEGEPTSSQRKIAKELVSAGANFIIGHHPHVIYEIEPTDKGLIAYSLGNFVFDLPWDRRMLSSGVLDLRLSEMVELKRSCSYDAKFWPVSINKSGKPKLSSIYPLLITRLKPDIYGGYLNPVLENQFIKKITYILVNLCRGNTSLKVKFLVWKLKCKMKLKM